jgi:hypothetical protein
MQTIDLGFVKPAEYGEGLAGLGEIAKEMGEAKKAQQGKKALTEAWEARDLGKLAQVSIDYPELADQAKELSDAAKLMQTDRLKKNAILAQMTLNIPERRDRENFLIKQMGKLRREGDDRWEDLREAIGVEDEEEQKRLLQQVVLLADNLTDYGKGAKDFANRAVFSQRKNPNTGQWEQGFSVYDPNEDKTVFRPIEGEYLDPVEDAELKLKYQQKYEQVKTDEEFQRLLNSEKTPRGKFELAKLAYEDATRRASTETIAARSQLGMDALDDLLGQGVGGLDMIYGAADMMIPETGVLAAIIRSQDGLDMLVKRDRMINILTLMARKELQGQGQITEGEQTMLARAVTVLNDNRMRPEDALSELEAIRPVFERAIRGIDSPELSGVQGQRSGNATVYPEGSIVKKDGVEYIKQNGAWVAR